MKHPSFKRQRGMTLIELMVALAIGLFLALAVTSILVITLRQQQTSAAVNVRDQNATQAIAQLDRTLRSAGSAFSYTGEKLGVFGCGLQVVKSGSTLVPSNALPAPFDKLSALNTPQVAPLVIEAGAGANGSDVILVVGGNSASGDIPRPVKGINAEDLWLDNTLSFRANDLLLLSAEGVRECYLTQVSSIPTISAGAISETLTLGGNYFAEQSSSASRTLTEIASEDGMAYVTPLGNASASYPVVKLIGAGDDANLYEYDLLQTRFTTPQVVNAGVSHLFALYGIDTDEDGRINRWVSPSETGWTADSIHTPPASGGVLKTRQIVAARIALVTRASDIRQTNVTDETLTLFSSLDASLQREVTLSAEQRAFRHRVIETIIPLRNNLIVESP